MAEMSKRRRWGSAALDSSCGRDWSAAGLRHCRQVAGGRDQVEQLAGVFDVVDAEGEADAVDHEDIGIAFVLVATADLDDFRLAAEDDLPFGVPFRGDPERDAMVTGDLDLLVFSQLDFVGRGRAGEHGGGQERRHSERLVHAILIHASLLQTPSVDIGGGHCLFILYHTSYFL